MPMRPPTEPIDETKVELSFISWLSSVTERVNHTMHYQFTGSPEPLVFHAPQVINQQAPRNDNVILSQFIVT